MLLKLKSHFVFFGTRSLARVTRVRVLVVSRGESIEPTSPLGTFATWVAEYAERLDPQRELRKKIAGRLAAKERGA